jgi:hypothetical protein
MKGRKIERSGRSRESQIKIKERAKKGKEEKNEGQETWIRVNEFPKISEDSKRKPNYPVTHFPAKNESREPRRATKRRDGREEEEKKEDQKLSERTNKRETRFTCKATGIVQYNPIA